MQMQSLSYLSSPLNLAPVFSCCHSLASSSVTVKLEKSLVMWVSSVMALTNSEAVTRTMEAVLGARGRRVWSQVWRLQTFWFLGHLTSENVNHYSFKRSKITQRKNGKDNR